MKKSPLIIPDPVFTYDDTAILLFRTHCMHYELAIALNEAYGLSLSRTDDIPLHEVNYPCFVYYDNPSHMAYVMIDSLVEGQADKVFKFYDKLLLVRGIDAWDIQQQFYNDLTSPSAPLSRPNGGAPSYESPAKVQHRRMLDRLSGLVFEPATFCFSDSRGIATSLYGGPVEAMPRATQAYMKSLRRFLDIAFDGLQWHLYDDD